MCLLGQGKVPRGEGVASKLCGGLAKLRRIVSQTQGNRVRILPESSPTIGHVVLLLHSAITFCTAVDARGILKAGKATIGHVFPCRVGMKIVTDRILKRGAGDLTRCTDGYFLDGNTEQTC